MNRRITFMTAALINASILAMGADAPTPQAALGTEIVDATSSAVVSDSLRDHFGCDSCRRYWAYGEYIQWWTRSDDAPALLKATRIDRNGNRLDETTYGAGFAEGDRGGFRGGFGFYPSAAANLGFEADWFSLGDQNDFFFVESVLRLPGGQFGFELIRPFSNAAAGGAAGERSVGGPDSGRTIGEVAILHDSRFYGGNVGFRYLLFCDDASAAQCECRRTSCGRRLELQFGYQFYQLNELLQINTHQSNIRFGQVFSTEEFENDNTYHGGYLGVAGEFNCGKWFLAGNVRGGVGDVNQFHRIDGSTTNIFPFTTTVSTRPTGPLLAMSSNIGSGSESRFTWVGELGARIGFQPVSWFRAYVGYNFLYINEVARPGGAVNPNVNPNIFFDPNATPREPSFHPRREAFWANGVSAGVELQF